MGFFGDFFNGKRSWWTGQLKPQESDVPFPEYQEDPDYRETQDYLKGLGIDILGGEFGAYSRLAETGSPEFEDMLSLAKRDIQKSTAEALASQGRGRGGKLGEVTAQEVGDMSIKARLADYESSKEGLAFMFEQGRGITEGVRGAGAREGERRNIFNEADYNRRYNEEQRFRNAETETDGDFFAQLLQTGVGAATGFATGGIPGAVIGGVKGYSGGGLDIADLFGKGPGKTLVGEQIGGNIMPDSGAGSISKSLKIPKFEPPKVNASKFRRA